MSVPQATYMCVGCGAVHDFPAHAREVVHVPCPARPAGGRAPRYQIVPVDPTVPPARVDGTTR